MARSRQTIAARSAWVAADGGPAPLALGAATLVSSWLILSLIHDPGSLTLLWPANALTLAAVLLGDRPLTSRRIAAGMVGGLIANALTGTVLSALLYSMANLAEVVVALWLLRAPPRLALKGFGVRSIGRFAIIAGGLAPAVGAMLGAGAAALLAGSHFADVWLAWYASCAIGAVILVPLTTILWRVRRRLIPRTRAVWIEMFGSVAFVLATLVLAFTVGRAPLLFLPFAALIVVTVRSGWLGAAGGLFVVAIAATAFTLNGQGPIMNVETPFGRALFLQLYLAVAFLTMLSVAALLDERQTLLRELRAAEARYRMLSEQSADALLHIDAAGRCIYASPASADLMGMSPREIEGVHLLSLVEPEDRQGVTDTHLAALSDPRQSKVVRYRVRDARRRLKWLETSTRALTGENGRSVGVVSVVRDVTQVVARERSLAAAATTDALTGLCNRRAFHAALDVAIAAPATGFAVAMLDLDHFKRINDTHGHPGGDAVLKAVAHAGLSSIRSNDTLARLGGEEFALLLPGADAVQAHAAGERIRHAVETLRIIHDGTEISVTLSIGAAVWSPGLDAVALMAAADAQLYGAKAGGRNQVRLAA